MTAQSYLFVLVYMMVQAVLFGIGTLSILATPLVERAFVLMPAMVVITLLLSFPISWKIALMIRLSNHPVLARLRHRALIIDSQH